MKKTSARERALLARALAPEKESLRLHEFYRGKIEIAPRCWVSSLADFSHWYTPGVAAPCREIARDPELSYRYTSRWNTIAVVSDGSRVLGLGDIGPEAGLPVMEGKALLFKYLGGVDAVPLCLKVSNDEEFIGVVKALEPTFGGINLEDISQPRCFKILERLRAECSIPVWHDDQQGTAAVTLAGLINALELSGKKLGAVDIALIGAGAANVRIFHILVQAGASPGRIVVCDSRGVLNRRRKDLEGHPWKWQICRESNSSNRRGGIAEAMEGADVLIALSRPGPGTIKPEWITAMAPEPVCFLCANPTPELWPWEAEAAGAKIVATGRSDFPNQVNNSLGFPGIFRGALDVRASTITDEMCIAAAEEIALCARERGLRRDYIIPSMEEWEVHPRVAAAVGARAIEQGVAAVSLSSRRIYQRARELMEEARRRNQVLRDSGLIKPKKAK